MRRIKLNHWFINDNRLSISLINFFVEIDMNSEYKYVLHAVNKESHIYIEFNTIEECIDFTENTIVNCKDNDELYREYKKNNCNVLVKKIKA